MRGGDKGQRVGIKRGKQGRGADNIAVRSQYLVRTNLQGSALRPLPGLSQPSSKLLPVQGRTKAADLAFSEEGGRRREKAAVGGSLPMGESMR